MLYSRYLAAILNTKGFLSVSESLPGVPYRAMPDPTPSSSSPSLAGERSRAATVALPVGCVAWATPPTASYSESPPACVPGYARPRFTTLLWSSFEMGGTIGDSARLVRLLETMMAGFRSLVVLPADLGSAYAPTWVSVPSRLSLKHAPRWPVAKWLPKPAIVDNIVRHDRIGQM